MRIYLSLTFVLLGLLGCATTPTGSAPELPGKTPALPTEAGALSLAGQQSAPSFSPSGNKMIYISWDRKNNKQRQVYEYDFLVQREQRITFQDGQDESPSYWSESQIIYSSNTDELKENEFNETKDARTDWFDLYMSDLIGEDIQRLTQQPGLDDKALKDPWNKSSFFFVSSFPKPGLYRFSLENKRRQLLVPGQIEFFMIQKNSQSLVGVEKAEAGKSLFEYNLSSKLKKVLATPVNSILALTETPWRDTYLIAEINPEFNSKLIFWNPQTRCVSDWRTLPGRVTHLDHSPKDPGTYLVSLIKDSKEQIYTLKGLPATLPCEGAANSDKVKQ